MQRGRAAGPLAKWVRYYRTHLAIRFCGRMAWMGAAVDDQFRRFVAGLGGTVYACAPDVEEDQLFLASLQSAQSFFAWATEGRNARGFRCEVVAGYLERMTPNAWASWDGKTHVIAMHQALMATIVEFALFAFTQRELFPGIGAADGEDSPIAPGGEPPGLLLLMRTFAGASVGGEADARRVPKDPDRYIAGIYLAMLMSRFVWLHELAHCFKGHVAQTGPGRLELTEFPEAAPLVVRREERPHAGAARRLRLMEFEADDAAFDWGLRIQLEGHENIDGIKALDLRTRLHMTMFASYAMTWLFEQYQRFAEVGHALTHPAPFDRLRALMQHACAIKGLEPLTEQVGQDMNVLRRAIPVMHGWQPPSETDAYPTQAERQALALALAPWRFDRTS